jgi:hypothetical protein
VNQNWSCCHINDVHSFPRCVICVFTYHIILDVLDSSCLIILCIFVELNSSCLILVCVSVALDSSCLIILCIFVELNSSNLTFRSTKFPFISFCALSVNNFNNHVSGFQ